MTDLLDVLDSLGIIGSEACLRWLYYHSASSEGDGVILGASIHGRYIEGALADGSTAEVRLALGEGPLGVWNSLTLSFYFYFIKKRKNSHFLKDKVINLKPAIEYEVLSSSCPIIVLHMPRF